MKEPAPCPFCGSEADTATLTYGSLAVRCPSVNCIAFDDWRDLDDWNTRPIEDALRADNSRLKEKCEALDACIKALDEAYMWRDMQVKSFAGCLNKRVQFARARLAEIRGEK